MAAFPIFIPRTRMTDRENPIGKLFHTCHLVNATCISLNYTYIFRETFFFNVKVNTSRSPRQKSIIIRLFNNVSASCYEYE